MGTECIKVLLVEDSAYDAVMVQRFLKNTSAPRFELTVVNRLVDALPTLRSGGCEAVLLDLSLPDSHGLASLNELAIAAPQIPIIVLTGLGDDSANVLAMRSGAQDYLEKEKINAEQLVRSIRLAIERKAFEQRLAQQARSDYLTGLGNRAFFEERLQYAVSRARRAGSKIALMFIDLDGFKQVNDIHGHAEGDIVLKRVADVLRSTVRDGETIARIGGDEFTIILDPIRDHATAKAAVNRIFSGFGRHHQSKVDERRVTLSIGVAIYPDHAEDAKELLSNADVAMFRAKSEGKDTFHLYRTD